MFLIPTRKWRGKYDSKNPWKWKWSCSVVSDSLWPHGLYPTRFHRPWNSPGKNTGVDCHFRMFSRVVPSDPHWSVDGCLAGWGFIMLSLFSHVGPLSLSAWKHSASLYLLICSILQSGEIEPWLWHSSSLAWSPHLLGIDSDFSQIGEQSESHDAGSPVMPSS